MTMRTMAVALALGLVAPFAHAGDIRIETPWARPAIADRPTAAYMTIRNAGEAADRLVGATSPAFTRIELHETTMAEGVMRMAEVAGIEAPAGGAVDLAPGGLHLMLFGAEERLAEGDRIPFTLRFERAGEVAIEIDIRSRPPEGAPSGGATHHGGHDHGSQDHGGHGGHGDHSTSN
ncbi:MAG: copper chaperone PCu(A)C [Paracoccaceae bacterium]